MNIFRRIVVGALLLPLLLTICPGALLAQGPLTPPTAPGPSQKSLQEIWDRVGNLEQRVQSQEATLQEQNGLLIQLAATSGTPLPWSVSTVDDSSSCGSWASISVSPVTGLPAIAYRDNTNARLKFAQFDGASWTTQIVDPEQFTGERVNLVYSPTGVPMVAYWNAEEGKLRYASRPAGTWVVEELGNTTANTPISLAVSPSGRPGIAYTNAGEVKSAEFNGTTWVYGTILGTASPAYAFIYLPNGLKGLAFYRAADGDIVFTQGESMFWTTATAVDAIGTSSQFSLAAAPNGDVYLAFNSAVGQQVSLRLNNSWSFPEVVSSSAGAGSGTIHDMAVNPFGKAAISLNDGATLRYITNPPTYANEVVYTGPSGNQIHSNSLAFSKAGVPFIAFEEYVFNSAVRRLRVATRKPFLAP